METTGLMLQNLESVLRAARASVDQSARRFIYDMIIKTQRGKETRHLAPFQIKWIEDLHNAYAAGDNEHTAA